MRQEQQDADDVVTEVPPGVLRAQLPIQFTGLGHVNSYFLEDERGWTVIDPGLPGPVTWRTLKKRLREAGGRLGRVHTIVVTHSHPDHFGLAERLRQETGADLVTGEDFRTFMDLLEADVAEDPEAAAARRGEDLLSPDNPVFQRKAPWGGEMPKPPLPGKGIKGHVQRRVFRRYMRAPRPTRRVGDGDHLTIGGRHFEVMHTPGHAEDHICLFDPSDGLLLSGDHVLPSITPHVSGMGQSVDPLADFVGSLEKVDRLEGVELVVPAHGLPFTNLGERVADIKRHHEERLEQLEAIGRDIGEAPVADYMQQLFSERAWGAMAESETYAHLEHLLRLDRAEVRTENEMLLYSLG